MRFDTNPFTERFQQIMDSEYAGVYMMLLAIGIVVAFLLVFFRAYRPLLLLLIVGETFSLAGGAAQGILTLLRFGTVFAMVALGAVHVGKVGLSQKLMIGYALYMFLWVPVSENPSWSFQLSVGFLLLVVGIAGATANFVSDLKRLHKLLGVLALLGVLWVAINVAFGHAAQEEYFSDRWEGVSQSRQSMGSVSAIFAPFLLWGLFRLRNQLYRYICGAAVLALFPMVLITGQRVGLFGAVIGVIPGLAFRVGIKRTLGGILVVLIAGVLSWKVFSVVSPETQDFIRYKYVTHVTDTTGRAERWSKGLEACLANPLVGHGAGMADYFSHRYFTGGLHSAYLSNWYDGGTLVVIVWFGVIISAGRRCLRLLLGRASPEAKEAGRAVFGCFLTLVAVGFFESSMVSTTNVSATMFVVCLVVIDRLWRLAHQPQPAGQRALTPAVAGYSYSAVR